MKIVRLTTALDFGGVEKRIEISAREFNKRDDVDLYVVAIGSGGAISGALKNAGVNTILLNQKHRIPRLGVIVKLFRLFRNLKPDVIHTSGAEANFHGLIAAYFAGVRIRIGEEIGYPNHNFIWRVVFNITYRFAHKVIGISDSVVKKIVGLGEVPAYKAVVVYNPVEMPVLDLTKKKQEKDSRTFITVSRLVPVKNLNNLIHAFKLTCENCHIPLRLHIVGDGPEFKLLRDLARKEGLADRVIFFGFQEHVQDFLLAADFYILPSFSEGFSIALVEAMLAELVCIATNMGGPTEIIKENETGYLLNPYSVEDMKLKMLNVLTLSAAERMEMGTRAREDVLKRFTPEQYINHLLFLYNNA